MPASHGSRRRRRSINPTIVRAVSGFGARCACEAMENRVLLSGATFATPTSVPVSGAKSPIVTAFFEVEGYPVDIAVATPTAVNVLTNNSDGSFSSAGTVTLPANPASQSPFVPGDFSGNGIDDMVLLSHNTGTGNGTVTYETSNGDGTFTAGPTTNITDGGKEFTPLSGGTADFNVDGDDDLAIVGKPGTGTKLVLAILTSKGDGTFTEADISITGSNPAGTISNEEVFTGITNEIVVYDGSGGNLDVFSGTGSGSFTQLTPAPLTASLLALGTFNSNQDLVVANGDQVSILVNQNDGTFQPDPQGRSPCPGRFPPWRPATLMTTATAISSPIRAFCSATATKTFNTTQQRCRSASAAAGARPIRFRRLISSGTAGQGFVAIAASGNSVVSAVNTRRLALRWIWNRATIPPVRGRMCS